MSDPKPHEGNAGDDPNQGDERGHGRPPMHDRDQVRGTCSFMEFPNTPHERACAGEPVAHVMWEFDAAAANCKHSLVCAEHRKEALARWNPILMHALSGNCAMPGAVWDMDINACVYPNGLPVSHARNSTGLLVGV